MIKNVLASLLSYGTNVVIAFFLSPYILRRLGDSQYGVWALFGEMLTYYGLLDFGVRGALSYYAGKALAAHQNDNLKRYLSTAFVGLSIIAVFAFALTTGLLFAFRDRLGDATISPQDVFSSASFFLFIFCLGLPLEVFTAVLTGNVRLYLVNTSEITARVISTALMFAALAWKPSLISLAATQLVGKSIYWGSYLLLLAEACFGCDDFTQTRNLELIQGIGWLRRSDSVYPLVHAADNAQGHHSDHVVLGRRLCPVLRVRPDTGAEPYFRLSGGDTAAST